MPIAVAVLGIILTISTIADNGATFLQTIRATQVATKHTAMAVARPFKPTKAQASGQRLNAATSGHSATLAWNAGAVGSNCAPPATLGYNVYRGTAAGNESSTPLNATLITTTGYVDASVQVGQTYSYIVKSQETCGTMTILSAPSNEIIVQFPNPPTAATLQAIVIN